MEMIKTVDLRVDYDDFTAVKDLNLSIAAGEIYGLIGPNGAGKTSTFRVLSTLLEPTYGEVYIHGMDVLEHPQKVQKILGYMPDLPVVYEKLTVYEFLDLFAASYLVPFSKKTSVVNDAMEKTNLTEKRNFMCGQLSRGMKQRLLLAKVLLQDAKVLLLDEPAGGLDPIARIDLRNVLKGLASEGKTILVSSHILSELSDFCTSVGIMERGHMVLSGKINEIGKTLQNHSKLYIEFLNSFEKLEKLLQSHALVSSFSLQSNYQVEVLFEGNPEDASSLLKEIVQNDISVYRFYEEEMDIEDIFLQIGAKRVA